ncbi:MAG: PQQ-dependent sugar dehydrogenase [Burkholderiales bacterium]|nr:PQQ-dependent sugar dehydrogenase [Burkholderiales bacterium]
MEQAIRRPRQGGKKLSGGAAALLLAALLLPIGAAAQELRAVDVARGLDHPWSLAFLPDGRMLVTERSGRLRIVGADGRLSAPVAGLPTVAAGGQCGLLDVVLDPEFAENRRIYWSYAEAGEGGNSTAVARGRLQGEHVDEVQVLFRQQPKVHSAQHCGGRLVFARDGRLFVTLGDRFSRKEDAQNLANHLGKIVRIEADGGVPADNPFVGRPGAAPEIWSLGHRNVQGAALHPETGELWESEHGPQGGDEINLIEGGRNYGWPLLTFGRNYGTGTRIGEEGPKPGFEQPLKTWVPISIAPSGMAFLTSDRYPAWKGDLFVGALRGLALHRLTLQGRSVVGEQRLLTRLNERIRDVRQGPDGWLYVLTDSPDGRVIRLER